MSSAITVRALSFELPNGRTLFQNLNFTLGLSAAALVGPNGIGKSCLARLLAAELRPTTGQVIVARPVTYLAQREPAKAITVAALLNDYPQAYRSVLLHGVPLDLPCTALSGGQWMRVRLACALGDAFTILDEPTNDLDAEGRAAVLEYIDQHRGGLLLISHDAACLEHCEQVLELSSQGIAMHSGGWQDYLLARGHERGRLQGALQAAKAEREYTRRARQASHARQQKRAARGAQRAAQGGMPRISQGLRRGRAQETYGRVDAANAARANAAVRAASLAYDALKVDPVMYAELLGIGLPKSKLVAEARDFNVRFGDWLYARDLNFAWRGNIRIALEGRNGSGKSTLLRALTAFVGETRGSLHPGDLPTLFIDQRCAQLVDALSILDNVRQKTGLSEKEARNGLAKFLFARDAVFQPVATLSGGERLRAALAQGFLAPIKPQCLILDEPTNNLDATNVSFLQTLVRQFPGAVIVVSHDEGFVQACGIGEVFSVDKHDSQFLTRI